MIRLSDRLNIVFENLIPQRDVWDLCCDHGYLATAAYKSEKFADVYFVDRVPAIIEKVYAQFHKYEFRSEAKSQTHFLCNDAANIDRTIQGNLSITGVGGLTIFMILRHAASNGRLEAERLILGPQRDDKKLLDFIQRTENLQDYILTRTISVLENKRNRYIYVLDRMR